MTETIAAEELARLGALLEKATRGPWNHLGYCGQDGVIQGARQIPVASAIAGKTSGHTGHQAFDDAALIVAAVNALPALLEAATRVKVLEEALENEERRHLVTIDQRDQAEAAADMLAHDIGRICDIDVGEHSNLNSPWANAHEAATERTALTASEDDRGSKGEGRG